jgi:DNA-directed RNA polymerase sigma subunit (sigma70/sigma32)
MTHRPAAPGSAVRTWIDHSSSRQPLCERAVLELSRRVQRWQQHPAGPSHAPKPVRRSALRARDQLVNHNLRLVTHTWQRQCHSASLPAREEGTVEALQEAALNLVRAAEKFDPAKGYRFSTYATFWVQRGLNDYQQRYMRSIRFPAESGNFGRKRSLRFGAKTHACCLAGIQLGHFRFVHPCADPQFLSCN